MRTISAYTHIPYAWWHCRYQLGCHACSCQVSLDLQTQRPADPRVITFQEVNHTPLALPSAAAEAWRGSRMLWH
jgi:hypothetical protein